MIKLRKPKADQVDKPAKAKPPKRRIRSGRGALFIVALLLISSGAVRLAGGTGAAIARELSQDNSTIADGQDSMLCEADPELTDVLDALKSRETRIAEREAALVDRERAIALARAEIDENLQALIAAEKALSATMALADEAAESDLAQLTAVYENMKPKEAALLFEEMDPNFAAGFLGRMRSDAAAAVMAGLEPATAYTISVILAGRNANVPTQ